MKIPAAKRTEKLTHAIRDVVTLAQEEEKKGKKILYLNIGDPNVYDYETPKHIVDAIFKNEKTHEGYSHALGELSAREAVFRECERNGIKNLELDDIVLTVGGSEGINFVLSALLNSNDDILIPSPGYSLYNAVLRLIGCEENSYYLDEENNWQIDVDELKKRKTENTKAIAIINPNNPTGGVYSKKTLEEIIDFANDNDLVIVSDETYDKLIFDGMKHNYLGSMTTDVPVITLGSLSKNYLMPGYRAGWIAFSAPENRLSEVNEAVKKLCKCRLSNVNPVQPAYKAAYEGPQEHLKDLVEKLQKRRDIAYKRLNEIEGLSCIKPQGAFYAFPKIEVPVKSDKDFVLDLLRTKGVLTVFGAGFGQKEGTNHFRIVFLPNEEILSSAFDKIEEFIKEKYLK
ncbi:MAG: aminotransferase class I/II-fold pyridoxal phosphate-dependent enzyme [Candidatus Diapherotrites archaeon]